MNRKKTPSAILALAACALLLAGCAAGSKPGDVDGESTDIALVKLGKAYTAGYYTISASRAHYWVDSEAKTIAEADQGVATQAACVVPTTFGDYVAGARTDFIDPVLIQRAILWFNGRGEFLDEAPSYALSAVLHDGKIFVAGRRDPDGNGDRPCVWEVQDSWTMTGGSYAVESRSIDRHDLNASEVYGEARDIISSGSDLYVCGNYWKAGAYQACYWKNGDRIDLDGGRVAMAICEYAGKVYVGGKSATSARYWIDGVGSDLSGFPSGSTDAIVTAVAMGEGGLLLGGSYYTSDDYGFKRLAGTLTTSLPRVIGAGARGSDLYLGCEDGWLKNAAYSALPWLDGTRRPKGIGMRLY